MTDERTVDGTVPPVLLLYGTGVITTPGSQVLYRYGTVRYPRTQSFHSEFRIGSLFDLMEFSTGYKCLPS